MSLDTALVVHGVISSGHPTVFPPCQVHVLLQTDTGAEQGRGELRQALCDRFYADVGRKPGEIFVSDGSKCDIGRLLMMFGADASVAVQVCQAGIYTMFPTHLGEKPKFCIPANLTVLLICPLRTPPTQRMWTLA